MSARTYDPKPSLPPCVCACDCKVKTEPEALTCKACRNGLHNLASGVRGPVLVVYPANGVEWLRVVM